MSRVRGHVSHIMRHASHVKQKWEKVVELVGQGSVINGGTPSSFLLCVALLATLKCPEIQTFPIDQV